MRYGKTERSRDRRIESGRGQGEGENYTPFIFIHEIPSKGRSYRYVGWKTGRVHHFLSTNEMHYFMVLEWQDRIRDIREQYPLLPLSTTEAIADTLHVKHPTAPGDVSWPMTSDFVLTVQSTPLDQPRTIVRTVKPAQALTDQRVCEKLAIERAWWRNQDVDWKIVRDQDIPHVLAENVAWLHGWRNARDLPLHPDRLPTVIGWLDWDLARNPNQVLAHYGQRVDYQFDYTPGTGMAVIRHLLARKHWRVPMDRPIRPLHVIPTRSEGHHDAIALS